MGISIHVPREGHDLIRCTNSSHPGYFNPRAPRGARHRGCISKRVSQGISIHVPREGHDARSVYKHVVVVQYFNPRAPRGARLYSASLYVLRATFQSTCPARGTTLIPASPMCFLPHFNPRAPRGARRVLCRGRGLYEVISIHVPREGHDNLSLICVQVPKPFQSTCPARGTTRHARAAYCRSDISIHVPREGHDADTRQQSLTKKYFNPRAPRGARRAGF